MPAAPTTERWMTTRSRNATAHPGVVDISMEETADNVPKTPAPKKRRARAKKGIKSAEDIEAGIQRVAAYERQSLNEELIDATPQVVNTPAPPQDPSSYEHNKGGNISDNASYQPSSESVGDILMSEAGIGSLHSPVGETVGQGKKETKGGDKKAIVFTEQESSTESDDEPTPFKKVMSEKGKRFGKDISVDAVEETPIKAMTKGRKKVPIVADDSVTMSDKLVMLKKTGNGKAPAAAKQVSRVPAVAGRVSGSGNKSVQPIPAPTRPKPKPFKQPEPPTPTSALNTVTAKPVSNPKPSDDMPDKLQTKSSKPNVPKAKSELSMVREALKKAQEEVKKAQEAEKKAWAKTKESTKELGVRNRIKAVNDGEDGKALSLHPPDFSRLSSTSNKPSTHQDQDITSSKPRPRKFTFNAKVNDDPLYGVYDFGSDDAGNVAAPKPSQQTQDPPIDDIFDFGSFGDDAQGGFEGGDDHGMVIDVVEPAAKAVGKPQTTKNVVVGGGSGLAKSGNERGGKTVKGKATKGISIQEHSQACHQLLTLIDDHSLTPESEVDQYRQETHRSASAAWQQASSFPSPTMLTLDSTTLFFYSRIISINNMGPPSKKRKAECDLISTWIDNVEPGALPTYTSSLRPPPLTTGTTRSSSSALTNTIRVTQNTFAIKTEPKEARIEVIDQGAFSDYDETEGQEREVALASKVKHGVRATSTVSLTIW